LQRHQSRNERTHAGAGQHQRLRRPVRERDQLVHAGLHRAGMAQLVVFAEIRAQRLPADRFGNLRQRADLGRVGTAVGTMGEDDRAWHCDFRLRGGNVSKLRATLRACRMPRSTTGPCPTPIACAYAGSKTSTWWWSTAPSCPTSPSRANTASACSTRTARATAGTSTWIATARCTDSWMRDASPTTRAATTIARSASSW